MEKNWYVVHTYSGFEEKVKQSIEEKAKGSFMEEKMGRILIPTEKVLEVRGGKKRETDRKFYPGYILVEMELDDESWREEKEQILSQLERGPVAQVKTQFEPGDQVRITDGSFQNFTGTVDEVDTEHGRLRVMVSIFSRQTPVELNFFQVEKA
ncbi:MAG: transcription termination/antitermination NusG family protein [Nitrospirota bacterium]